MSLTDDAARAVQALGAIAFADRAEEGAVEARRRACAQCPNLTFRHVAVIPVSLAICGRFLEATPTTCGCIVGRATTDTEDAMRARLVPTGKAVVAKHTCPSGRWIG